MAASPIAAASLILAILPVLVISRGVEKLGWNQIMKLVSFIVVGVVYFFIYAFIFDAQTLGVVYGVGVLLLGVGQTIVPYFKQTVRQRENMHLGRYMAGVQETINTSRQMQQGVANIRGR